MFFYIVCFFIFLTEKVWLDHNLINLINISIVILWLFINNIFKYIYWVLKNKSLKIIPKKLKKEIIVASLITFGLLFFVNQTNFPAKEIFKGLEHKHKSIINKLKCLSLNNPIQSIVIVGFVIYWCSHSFKKTRKKCIYYHNYYKINNLKFKKGINVLYGPKGTGKTKYLYDSLKLKNEHYYHITQFYEEHIKTNDFSWINKESWFFFQILDYFGIKNFSKSNPSMKQLENKIIVIEDIELLELYGYDNFNDIYKMDLEAGRISRVHNNANIKRHSEYAKSKFLLYWKNMLDVIDEKNRPIIIFTYYSNSYEEKFYTPFLSFGDMEHINGIEQEIPKKYKKILNYVDDYYSLFNMVKPWQKDYLDPSYLQRNWETHYSKYNIRVLKKYYHDDEILIDEKVLINYIEVTKDDFSEIIRNNNRVDEIISEEIWTVGEFLLNTISLSDAKIVEIIHNHIISGKKEKIALKDFVLTVEEEEELIGILFKDVFENNKISYNDEKKMSKYLISRYGLDLHKFEKLLDRILHNQYSIELVDFKPKYEKENFLVVLKKINYLCTEEYSNLDIEAIPLSSSHSEMNVYNNKSTITEIQLISNTNDYWDKIWYSIQKK